MREFLVSIAHRPREQTLKILRNHAAESTSELLKALYDIRYTLEIGDEESVFPLLNNPNDSVAASALFTLWYPFSCRDVIEPIIRKWARGDARDVMDMPIQCMAIGLLSELARTDNACLTQLVAIAEDQSQSDMPRLKAWECLAEHFQVNWLGGYTTAMIFDPHGAAIEDIRELIRHAMSRAK